MLILVMMVILPISNIKFPEINTLVYGFLGKDITETKILFLGDVMLGRYVETLINKKGSTYPFIGMESLAGRYDQVVGNFEAPLSQDHKQTDVESFNFSISTTSVDSIGTYFSILSLANNHTFDKGEEGLAFTKDILTNKSVKTFGDPNVVDGTSVAVIPHGEQTIALVAINAVTTLDSTSTIELLSDLNTKSDMQIVYVHWGTEYKLEHSQDQEGLARLLIDHGADAIIGHHPHVIQDIDIYKGAPIFYSLGNFVFDQYFDDNVQIGLGVELVLQNSELTYRLVPFTSKDSKSSPRLMTVDERSQLLIDLSSRSSPVIAEKLRESGIIYIIDTLASL